MNNTAIVNRIEKNEIYLIHIKDYGKKEKTERDFWKIKDQEFKALNPKLFSIKSGDAVEYFIPEGKTIIASFMVLIFPLIVFLLTFALLSALGLDSEKMKALLSIGTMLLSFSITKLLKKLGFKETLPIITDKISKETLNKFQSECKDCGSCTICKS